MDSKSFKQLISSVREGGEILRGDRTKLSQRDFANFFGVSVKTLQNWEQNRRKPTGPAEALLRLIAAQPRLARKPVSAR